MNINDVWTAETTYNGKPLDNEAEVIEAAKAGDSAAYYTLAMQYSPLLRQAVRNAAEFDGDDTEDAQASALAAFWTAITEWTPGKYATLGASAKWLLFNSGADANSLVANMGGRESAVSPRALATYRQAMAAADYDVDAAREVAGARTNRNYLSAASFDAVHAVVTAERADVADLADMAEPVDAFTRWEKLTDTRNAVDALEPKHRAVIRRAYGFDGTGSEDVNVRAQVFPAVHSDGEVSKYVDVSRRTVLRYREAGLASLKVSLAAYGPESREV